MTEDFSFIKTIDFGSTGPSLSHEEIAQTQEKLVSCNLLSLPQEVIDFLKIYNGFRTEGRTIFGIDSQKHFFYDIIGENLNAALEKASDILLLGETDMTWVAWIDSQKSYAIIDKDTQMVLHKLDNFKNAVKYILQIDE